MDEQEQAYKLMIDLQKETINAQSETIRMLRQHEQAHTIWMQAAWAITETTKDEAVLRILHTAGEHVKGILRDDTKE